ncbi:MAG: hypothetical protein Tsb009_38290 [Planctomycetaceae bacterium]
MMQSALASIPHRWNFHFALAAFCLTVFASENIAAQTTFFGWHSDLNEAKSVSARTGKPIFVVFRCVR